VQLERAVDVGIVASEEAARLERTGAHAELAQRVAKLVEVDGARLVGVVADKGGGGAYERGELEQVDGAVAVGVKLFQNLWRRYESSAGAVNTRRAATPTGTGAPRGQSRRPPPISTAA